jgi:hypothetical protein
VRALLVFALVATGCAGARHQRACEASQHEPASAYRCESDRDCGICHDGSDCGTVMSTTEIASRGAACTQTDRAMCELATPHCCGGRCVLAIAGPD